MSRLRMGSLSNPFAKSQEPQSGLLSVTNDGRPSNHRSQSALLPLTANHTNSAEDEEESDSPARTPEGSSSNARRNRSHTVAVAIGSGRRGSGPDRRRGSTVSQTRDIEEGRNSRGNRPGSPVEYELGDEQEDLNDEVVGVLDVIDPEVSTGEYLSKSKAKSRELI
jgi:hypothetical protein